MRAPDCGPDLATVATALFFPKNACGTFGPAAAPPPGPVTLSNNLHELRSVFGRDQYVGKRAAVA